MRVLGIDPGYAIVGWGVVDYVGNRFAPVDFGAVCTDAGVPFERRLDEVYTGVKEVIARTQPEVLAIEKLFYQHNQTTVMVIPCLCLFTALRTLAAEPPVNKKRTRTLFRKESGSSTNCMVDGTGLEPVTSCTSSRCSTS